MSSTIIKLIPPYNNGLISLVKTFLMNEQIIALPTDTIYGLAADITSSKAIKRLYEIKSRDFQKPLAICVGDVEDIYKYSFVTVPKSLLNQLLPGAITVIFKRNNNLNPSFNPGTDLVGVRIPNNDFVRQICRQLGPIALTSANLSNEPSCLNIEEFKHLWPMVDAIFDAGSLGQIDPQGLGSTVIDFSTKDHYRVVRNGCFYEQTINIIQKYNLKPLL